MSLKLIGPPDGPSSPDGFGLGPTPVACHGPPLVLATKSSTTSWLPGSEIPGNAKAQRPSTLLEGPGSNARPAEAVAITIMSANNSASDSRTIRDIGFSPRSGRSFQGVPTSDDSTLGAPGATHDYLVPLAPRTLRVPSHLLEATRHESRHTQLARKRFVLLQLTVPEPARDLANERACSRPPCPDRRRGCRPVRCSAVPGRQLRSMRSCGPEWAVAKSGKNESTSDAYRCFSTQRLRNRRGSGLCWPD